MIKLEGITKSFGSLQILKGIDLEIAYGILRHRAMEIIMAGRILTANTNNAYFVTAGQCLDNLHRVGDDGNLNVRDLPCQKPTRATVIQ